MTTAELVLPGFQHNDLLALAFISLYDSSTIQ